MFKKLFILLLILSASPVSFGQRVENINFYNGRIKLAGTVFIPEGAGKHPAIAVTHGSGQEGRSQAGYISFANTLVKQGFVVLIYDKRGVGDSEGKYVEVPDMNVPAGDLVEAVRYLKTREEVNKDRIGVYGHSQGGWVAPLAAVTCADISFVIVSCGGGISMREQDIYSYIAGFKKDGYSNETIDSIVQFSRQLFTYLASGIGYSSLNPMYTDAVRQKWFDFFKKMGFTDRLPGPSMLKEPVFNFFKTINYDPQSTLRALNVPTLLILASDDQVVPSDKCKLQWENAFYAGGHKELLTTITLPGENHFSFEQVNNKIVYKKSFSDSILKWLEETIK